MPEKDYRPISEFHTKIVGVTFPNDDGSSRQDLIAGLRVGEPLKLVHAPFKGHPTAVKVFKLTGEQLGWIRSELSAELADDSRRGRRVDVRVASLTGGGRGEETLGCNLFIVRYSLRKMKPKPRRRTAKASIDHSDAQPERRSTLLWWLIGIAFVAYLIYDRLSV